MLRSGNATWTVDSSAVLLLAKRSHGPTAAGHVTTHPPHAVRGGKPPKPGPLRVAQAEPSLGRDLLFPKTNLRPAFQGLPRASQSLTGASQRFFKGLSKTNPAQEPVRNKCFPGPPISTTLSINQGAALPLNTRACNKLRDPSIARTRNEMNLCC